MQTNESFVELENLVATGRFRQASERLQVAKLGLQRIDATRTLRLSAELAMFLGDLVAAERQSLRLLADTKDPIDRAAAHRVLAEVHANNLDFEASLSDFSAARAILNSSRVDHNRVTLEL